MKNKHHPNFNILFIGIKKHSLKVFSALAAIFGFGENKAQIFEEPVISPFGLPTDLSFPIGTSADLDNDGDLDLIISTRDYYSGSYDYTRVLYFQNIGNANEPLFAEGVENFIPVPAVSGYSYIYFRSSQLADIDGDGDFDLIMSEYSYEDNGASDYHQWYFFENTGTAATANFIAPVENPFGLAEPGYLSVFEFGDIDNDGDLDFFAQNFPYDYASGITFQENIGTAANPIFDAPQLNPFGLTTTDDINVPQLGDLDGDGDLDILVAGYNADFHFFENTGTVDSPIFASSLLNPFGLVAASGIQFPDVLDIDSDGDFDVLSGVYSNYNDGQINFHKNNLVTGLELIEEIDLTVFPNPSADFVQINLESQNQFDMIRLVDLNGKIVLEKLIKSAQIQLDVRSLTAGTYTLLFSNDSHYASKKIIKK